jgi:transketolase
LTYFGRPIINRGQEQAEGERLTEVHNSSPIPARGTPERARLVALLAEKAKFVRRETVRLTRIAGAGHYTGTFSAAELFAALYYAQLRFRHDDPAWPDRDRFVLSKGHAAIGLYPVLGDVGFFPAEALRDYTRLGSSFGDHPDMRKVPGIDFSSGSLGHGLSVALGMALSARVRGTDYLTYCMVGDGELAEGQVWSAAMAAGHFGVGSLIAIVDRNKLSIDGPTESVMGVEPLADKFAAFRWDTRRIDGHDLEAILDQFASVRAERSEKPIAIIADTVKGRGVQRMELDKDWHVGNLTGEDYDDVLAEIDGGLMPVRNPR